MITLPNKLQALLISDPEADKSAAALDVNVGCALDPAPLFGTAHFLEHMLFQGNEKYPGENDYSEYIKDHGGYSNANTWLENTNFHFEVSNEGFEGALDIFSQFFISPSFKEDSAAREVKAVDSEYNMSLQNDSWRFLAFLCHISNEGSKLHRFFCGNVETLEQEGIRDSLLAFHKEWYSANIMKLCMSGRHSLEKLEKLAVDLFSPIVNKDVVLPDLTDPIMPYSEANLG